MPGGARLSALLAASIVVSVSSLSCLNEEGDAVPWWFVFKQNNALDYAYVDAANEPSGPLRMLGKSLDCAGGIGCALGATLQQLIDASAAGTAARVAWNDELPAALSERASPAANASASSPTSGHTKGVLGANATGGFLLSHTLPKFPVLTAAYRYVGSVLYAQTYLCISLDPAGVEAAASGAMHVDPHVYASLVPSGALTTLYPTVTALVAGARTSGSAAVALRSTAGNMFTYYVKSGDFGKDLWEDVVQAALQVNMWVETWRRPPVMETYCTPEFAYDSINVDMLGYVRADGSAATYRYTQDHSKLGIAINSTSQTQWICVADNNRM